MLIVMAEYTTKQNQIIFIFRDLYGKWYVTVDGVTTQSRLNASEIVRYLANALEGK